MTSPIWRSDNESRQPLGRSAPFTFTMNTGDSTTSRTIFTVADRMQEVYKISLVVDTADVFISFDVTAVPAIPAAGTIHAALLIPAGSGYSEENIFIGTRIVAMNATVTNARIRGVCWGK